MDKYNNNNNNKLAKTNWKMWVPGIKGGGGENVYVVVGKKSLSCVVVVLKFKHMQRIKNYTPQKLLLSTNGKFKNPLANKKKDRAEQEYIERTGLLPCTRLTLA